MTFSKACLPNTSDVVVRWNAENQLTVEYQEVVTDDGKVAAVP
jgi:hypothetical protein